MILIYAGSSVSYFRYGSDSLGKDIKRILKSKFENEKIKFYQSKAKKTTKSIKSLKKHRQNKISNPRQKEKKKNTSCPKELKNSKKLATKKRIM